jgi:hypothetical protein
MRRKSSGNRGPLSAEPADLAALRNEAPADIPQAFAGASPWSHVSLKKGGSVGGRSGVRPPTEPAPLRGARATMRSAWQSRLFVASQALTGTLPVARLRHPGRRPRTARRPLSLGGQGACACCSQPAGAACCSSIDLPGRRGGSLSFLARVTAKGSRSSVCCLGQWFPWLTPPGWEEPLRPCLTLAGQRG